MRYIFLILCFILLVVWLSAKLAFHIAGGMIHIVLLLAAVAFIIHVFTGRRAA